MHEAGSRMMSTRAAASFLAISAARSSALSVLVMHSKDSAACDSDHWPCRSLGSGFLDRERSSRRGVPTVEPDKYSYTSLLVFRSQTVDFG